MDCNGVLLGRVLRGLGDRNGSVVPHIIVEKSFLRLLFLELNRMRVEPGGSDSMGELAGH